MLCFTSAHQTGRRAPLASREVSHPGFSGRPDVASSHSDRRTVPVLLRIQVPANTRLARGYARAGAIRKKVLRTRASPQIVPPCLRHGAVAKW